VTTFFKSLKQLHAEHASALVAEAATKTELDAAKAEYDKLLQKFEEQHPEVVNRLTVARDKHQQTSEKTKAVDSEVRNLLSGLNKWETLPEGYEQIRRKKVVYSESILLRAAIQHAPFLLTIDEKKLEQFAFGVCEEVTKTADGEKLAEPYFILPEHYRQWLPSLHVNFEYAPRISTTKVQKHTPKDAVGITEVYVDKLLADKPADISIKDFVEQNPELKDLHNFDKIARDILDARIADEALPKQPPFYDRQSLEQVSKDLVNMPLENVFGLPIMTMEATDESPSGIALTFEIEDDGEPIEELFDSFFGTGDDDDPDPQAEPVF
jgi:hypothetical protein